VTIRILHVIKTDGIHNEQGVVFTDNLSRGSFRGFYTAKRESVDIASDSIYDIVLPNGFPINCYLQKITFTNEDIKMIFKTVPVEYRGEEYTVRLQKVEKVGSRFYDWYVEDVYPVVEDEEIYGAITASAISKIV